MTTNEQKSAISHLKCREIQAPLVSALIKGFAEKFGEKDSIELAKEIICKDAVLSGKALAEKFGGNSFTELQQIVEEVWAQDGTMTIENMELMVTKLQFKVTKCGYAELYESLGVKDIGTVLSCCRDFAFVDGFNPKLKLVRTKTIMQGDDCCDFCYQIK